MRRISIPMGVAVTGVGTVLAPTLLYPSTSCKKRRDAVEPLPAKLRSVTTPTLRFH